MAVTQAHHPRQQARRRRQRRPRGMLWLPVAIFAATVVAAASWVTYILWPRWPATDVVVHAPTLPIMVNGVSFNIPPASIRNKVQRKPGSQERVDLVFLWPSLLPPDATASAGPSSSPHGVDRLFVTIATSGNALSPMERFNTIYPRYLDGDMSTGPDGLTARSFRDETPYKGEDIVYDDRNPGRFMVRCTRDGTSSATIGMCLFERRIDQADVTIRFPRAWLSEWSELSTGLERLLMQIRGPHR